MASRVNIPTQELRGFVATDEAAPPKMLYPRDPSLDRADEPYEKLKRALRSEIDESAWSTLYSTASRPKDVDG